MELQAITRFKNMVEAYLQRKLERLESIRSHLERDTAPTNTLTPQYN